MTEVGKIGVHCHIPCHFGPAPAAGCGFKPEDLQFPFRSLLCWRLFLFLWFLGIIPSGKRILAALVHGAWRWHILRSARDFG
jgi:hypothetical protein